ncbi:hypothetical protein EHS39_28235 [Ensifer sp. MPMI2T]|nr:hypothetical protein EHS39_28235 [Ensifer sp. MPMI2T]
MPVDISVSSVVFENACAGRMFRRRRRQAGRDLLHVSLNRNRFTDKNMQQFKVLQRPLCV